MKKELSVQSLILFILLLLVAKSELFGVKLGDRFSFWAAAQSFVVNRNPYELDSIRAYAEATYSQTFALPLERVWGLPILFPLISWFSFFSFDTFLYVHAILVAACITALIASLRVLFPRGEGPSFSVYDALLLLTFFPMYVALIVGPIIVYLLLGLVLFLWQFRKHQDITQSFVGGLCLSLCLSKPHVLFLVMVLVLLLSILRNQWKTFLGVVSGFLILCLAALLIAPDIFTYYLGILREFPINLYQTPTLADYMRNYFMLPPATRFLPAVLGAFVLIVLVVSKRVDLREGSIHKDMRLLCYAIALSIVCAPYLWVYDFLPLLVVLCYMFSNHFKSQKPWYVVFIGAHLLLWLFALPMHYSVWYPLVLLLLFIWKCEMSLSSAVPEGT